MLSSWTRHGGMFECQSKAKAVMCRLSLRVALPSSGARALRCLEEQTIVASGVDDLLRGLSLQPERLDQHSCGSQAFTSCCLQRAAPGGWHTALRSPAPLASALRVCSIGARTDASVERMERFVPPSCTRRADHMGGRRLNI